MVNEMIDAQLAMIAECADADVAFAPVDPAADDPDAVSEEEKDLAGPVHWPGGCRIMAAPGTNPTEQP